MRRAFAEQIRRPLQALAARGNFFGALDQCVVTLPGKKRAAQPVQAQPRALGYAHHVPEARHGVREHRADRRRRFAVRVGEPVVHGCPADLRREACEQQHERHERRGRRQGVCGALQRMPAERREAKVTGFRLLNREDDDPEQRDGQAERRQHQVFPTRFECIAGSAERDQQRRGGGRRLDDQPDDGEVGDDRHGQQRGPEDEQRGVVPGRCALSRRGVFAVRSQIGGRHEHAAQADRRRDRQQHRARTIDQIPRSSQCALATAGQGDHGERKRRSCRGERRQRARAGRPGAASERAAARAIRAREAPVRTA